MIPERHQYFYHISPPLSLRPPVGGCLYRQGLLSSSAKAYKAERGGGPRWPVFFIGKGRQSRTRRTGGEVCSSRSRVCSVVSLMSKRATPSPLKRSGSLTTSSQKDIAHARTKTRTHAHYNKYGLPKGKPHKLMGKTLVNSTNNS